MQTWRGRATPLVLAVCGATLIALNKFVFKRKRHTFRRVELQIGGLEPKSAPFHICLLNHFGASSSHSVTANVSKSQQIVTLYPDSEHGVPLIHPEAFCPVSHLSEEQKLAAIALSQPMKVGCCVLISRLNPETKDEEILVTRRPKHLRIFPSTWVVPGGHLEAAETLEEGALREVREETGLKDFAKPTLFMLYESVYPHSLDLGLPSHHHLVIYYQVRLLDGAQELKLCPQEVDLAAWLSKDLVQAALRESEVSFFAFDAKTNSKVPCTTSQLNSYPDKDGKYPLERLTTGTRFLLEEWIRRGAT